MHDLFNSLKLLTEGVALCESHLRCQSEILSHCQLFIVGCGQLEDIASVGYVPLANIVNWSSIDIDCPLQECITAYQNTYSGLSIIVISLKESPC